MTPTTRPSPTGADEVSQVCHRARQVSALNPRRRRPPAKVGLLGCASCPNYPLDLGRLRVLPSERAFRPTRLDFGWFAHAVRSQALSWLRLYLGRTPPPWVFPPRRSCWTSAPLPPVFPAVTPGPLPRTFPQESNVVEIFVPGPKRLGAPGQIHVGTRRRLPTYLTGLPGGKIALLS